MTKRKAFATHMGISLVIFLILLFLIVVEWYPSPFFSNDGGWHGIRIIIGVDLVLGPLLTLIVFKPGKPGLKFDLTVIGIIQTCALAWGIWTVHHERPVAAVFVDGSFVTVTYYQIKDGAKTEDKLPTFGNKAPYWIYSNLPKNADALLKARLQAIHSGLPLAAFSKYYSPIDAKAIQSMKTHSLNMPEWVKDKPNAKQLYEKFLRHHQNDKNLFFLPFHARDTYSIVAIDQHDGHYVGSLKILPPQT